MSSRARAGWGGLAVVAVGTLAWAFVAQPEPTAPETLLPAGAVVYGRWDGSDAHDAEWRETAAYEALNESGLDELWDKTVEYIKDRAPQQARVDLAFEALEHTIAKGASMALTLPEDGPIPRFTLVLHDAAKLAPVLADPLKAAFGGEAPPTRNIGGREVTAIPVPDTPNIELGWWVEAEHLVVTIGPDATAWGVSVAAAKSPNITEDRLWKQFAEEERDFTVTSLGYVDVARLRETFGGMPLPPTPGGREVTINDLLAVFGLDRLNAIGGAAGYDGPAMRSQWVVDAPGPRKGLLALLDQEPITLADLPPMPKDVAAFQAASMNWGKAYDTMIDVARNMMAFGPPDVAEDFDLSIRQLPRMIGFDPGADLLHAFGNVTCGYADNTGPLGFGFGLAVSVENAPKLQRTLDRLLDAATRGAGPDEVSILRTDVGKAEMTSIEIGGGFLNPTFTVGQDWFVIGLTPQTVRSFILREKGRISTWSAEDHAEQFAGVPDRFTQLVYTDPRPGVEGILGMAPMLLGFAQAGMRQSGEFGEDFRLPVTAADFPPAELVTEPLFPNVAYTVVTEQGVEMTSRSSLPSLPTVNGAAVPVLVALLLPAVQQAREAARRTASKNNLKQIGIALHNHHDVYRSLPRGTVENADIAKAEDRLSWMVQILPFIEQAALNDRIDRKKAWNDEANERWTGLAIQTFVHPSIPNATPGQTHYVGIAGHGKDAATLALPNRRAGAFGYDRQLRFRDVTDGLSNTMGVAEASGEYGNWAAGGNSTIRAFTEKPYIKGPDGIGGPSPGGCNVLMLDGSVRFLSENINGTVVEALSTIQGAEVVDIN